MNCTIIIEVFKLVKRNSCPSPTLEKFSAPSSCDEGSLNPAAVTYAAAERCSSGLLQAASNKTGLAMAGPAEHWKASLLL